MNNSAAIAKIDTSLEANFIVFEAAPMSKKSESYANLLPYFLWLILYWFYPDSYHWRSMTYFVWWLAGEFSTILLYKIDANINVGIETPKLDSF